MKEPLHSAVSGATGIVGLIGLLLGTYAMSIINWPLGTASLIVLASCALPMILWQLVVEKVYRQTTAGLNFTQSRPIRDSMRDTGIKLMALWTTWCLILLTYWVVRYYTDIGYRFYFDVLKIVGPWLILLSIPYVFFVDRYSADPHDGLWQMGQWLCGKTVDRDKLVDYGRGWGIKAFFLAAMMSILPFQLRSVLNGLHAADFASPPALFHWSISALFLIDVCFGALGYMLTLKLLDAHIRSANPYMAGWTAALICYAPFSMTGGILDYTANGQEWLAWFKNDPLLLIVWGSIAIALTVIYVSATVIFGIRFSNLTNRGIITNGPYRYFKHPAYLSKNLSWWFISVPFLSSAGIGESLRNCILLLLINSIYYCRAKTEERHLMADPAYQAYSEWIAENGILGRLKRKLERKLGKGRSSNPSALDQNV